MKTYPAYFIFDVESVGLHGEGFAVAGGVYLDNGSPQTEFCFACPIDEAKGNDEGRKWVKENVPPIFETHRTPKTMRDEFWHQWELAKKQYPGIVMASECGWPVEARFLCAVIDDDPKNREWSGPYPMHEISSYVAASGFDPMEKVEREFSETPAHNPLADARLSARMLFDALCVISKFRST